MTVRFSCGRENRRNNHEKHDIRIGGDSGGFGLTVLIQSFVAAVTGSGEELVSAEEFTHAEGKVAIEHVRDWAGSKYMYCTEFLLHSEDGQVLPLLQNRLLLGKLAAGLALLLHVVGKLLLCPENTPHVA